MRRRGLTALLVCLMCVACGADVQWSDEPPSDLRGLWIESTDDDAGPLDFRDSIRITADRLLIVTHEPDGTPHKRNCAPIQRVSRTEEYFDTFFVIFCGPPRDDFIAETRIEVDPNEAFDEAVVSEVYSPWGGGEAVLRSRGRFENSRRHNSFKP